MGLDLYLYRVQKINSKKKIWMPDEIEEQSIVLFENDNFFYESNTIKNNCVDIKVRQDYYNKPKILKDFGFKEDEFIEAVSFSPNAITFSVGEDGNEQFIKIDQEDVKNKYIFSQINKQKACILSEVAYQRKGLNDTGWALLPANCEYCDNKLKIEEMVEKGNLSEDFIINWIDEETVFQAWW